MEQVSDNYIFQIILQPYDNDDLSKYWQKQCRYLFDKLHIALPEGSIKPSTVVSPYGERTHDIVSFSIIIVSKLENISAYTISKIIYDWSKFRLHSRIILKFPNGSILDITNQSLSQLVTIFSKLSLAENETERDDFVKLLEEIIDSETALIRKPTNLEKETLAKYEREQSEVDIKKLVEEAERKYYSEEIDKIVNEEFKRLSTGHITFNIAKTMKTGVSENAQANIAKTLSQIIEKVKDYSLRSEIKISPSMRVSLKGESGIFDIQAITKEVQLITDDVTTWEWTVKPLKSGEQTLFLSVDVLIEVPQCSIKEHSLPTLKEKIVVKVNPWYYIQCHSGVIIGTIGTIIGIATVLVAILTFIYKK